MTPAPDLPMRERIAEALWDFDVARTGEIASWAALAPGGIREQYLARADAVLAVIATPSEASAQAWDEGVSTALNHAILNDDGITLRLEHLDGRPWENPYRAALVDEKEARG